MKKEQIIHSLLLGAVGDALGYIAECDKSTRPIDGFRQFSRVRGGRYFPYQVTVQAGDFTDDTEYTIANATSLVTNAVCNPKLFEAHLGFYATHGTTGGRSMKKAGLKVMKRKNSLYDDLPKLFYASNNSDPFGYADQKGTGVVMRVAPFAFGLKERVDRLNAVYENGVLTHGSAEALWSGAVHAEVLRSLYEDPAQSVVSAALSTLSLAPETFLPSSDMMQEWVGIFNAQPRNFLNELITVHRAVEEKVLLVASALEKSVSFENCTELVKTYAPSLTAADSLVAAITLASQEGTDDGRLKHVANSGRNIQLDTDTVNSLVGQLTGVRNINDSGSVLETRVQDFGVLQRFAGYVYAVAENNLGTYVALADDWKEHVVEANGLWHPIFGEAEVLSAEKKIGNGKMVVRRIRFEKGKTMVVKCRDKN